MNVVLTFSCLIKTKEHHKLKRVISTKHDITDPSLFRHQVVDLF